MTPYKNEGIAIIILFILLFVPDKRKPSSRTQSKLIST